MFEENRWDGDFLPTSMLHIPNIDDWVEIYLKYISIDISDNVFEIYNNDIYKTIYNL